MRKIRVCKIIKKEEKVKEKWVKRTAEIENENENVNLGENWDNL